jgi:hypothetical protein
MHGIVISIDKHGVENDIVRKKIRELYMYSYTVKDTPESLEANIDKMISRIKTIVEN